MARFEDHFGGHSRAYADARPDYPEELFAWLASRTHGRALAWDCATGTGQAASRLRTYFDRVIATDASPGQVRSGRAAPGVGYAVAEAAHAPVAAGRVDLVAVAQALHWFDVPAFFAEVQRVLRPGGVLAVWGYGLCRVNPAIDAVLADFHDRRLAAWWPPERAWVAAGYPGLELPFTPLEAPDFGIVRHWDLATFLAYIGTWSGVKRAEAAGEAPASELRRALAPLWAGEHRVRWPLSVHASCRPAGA
ncbi:class I SAM-dependent methyltransferase [Arhodomonas sp. AD133]|uniref:class I SAM-dependent methyltransferase n=1 Tax=Arhodomonas sp. AD133 TaxID=3415009 RepID=UPI003EBAC4BA